MLTTRIDHTRLSRRFDSGADSQPSRRPHWPVPRRSRGTDLTAPEPPYPWGPKTAGVQGLAGLEAEVPLWSQPGCSPWGLWEVTSSPFLAPRGAIPCSWPVPSMPTSSALLRLSQISPASGGPPGQLVTLSVPCNPWLALSTSLAVSQALQSLCPPREAPVLGPILSLSLAVWSPGCTFLRSAPTGSALPCASPLSIGPLASEAQAQHPESVAIFRAAVLPWPYLSLAC